METFAETYSRTLTVTELRDESRLLRIDATNPNGWITPEHALAGAQACERMANAMVRDARIARNCRSSDPYLDYTHLRLVK